MPTKTVDTLPEDIHGLLEGHDLSGAIDKFKLDIGEMLVRRFSTHAQTRSAALRMSNIGRPIRQLWYEMNGYEGEKLSSQTKFKFLYGDILETLVLFLAEASGHKVERLQEEIEVDGIVGHIDAVIDGVLVDVKSCSTYSFAKFADGTLFNDDPFGYIPQLAGYRTALGLERAGYLAIDKVVGKICFLENSRDYDVRARIATVREAISLDAPPDRCYEDVPDGKSGNRKLAVGCSYCAYKTECWKDCNDGRGLQVYSYSTGPKFLTNVAKEPRVDFIKFPTKE